MSSASSSSGVTLTPEAVAAAVAQLRARRPLVQCIPNVVAAEIIANVVMAVGAAPAMVIGAEEAPQFAAERAAALSINIGALTAPALEAMRLAAAAAVASPRRPPWVLDPVACGGTVHRTRAARELLALGPALVRGNASEVMALCGAKGGAGVRGVDAGDAAEAALPAAVAVAQAHGCVVVVTGPTDFITDGVATLAVAGGHADVQRVTGTGCALSALMVGFVACAEQEGGLGALGYAAACSAFYKACAAAAAASDNGAAVGPGSLKVRLLDALAMPAAQVAAAVASVSLASVPTPAPAEREEGAAPAEAPAGPTK